MTMSEFNDITSKSRMAAGVQSPAVQHTLQLSTQHHDLLDSHLHSHSHLQSDDSTLNHAPEHIMGIIVSPSIVLPHATACHLPFGHVVCH